MWDWLTQDTFEITRFQLVLWWCVTMAVLVLGGFISIEIRSYLRARALRQRIRDTEERRLAALEAEERCLTSVAISDNGTVTLRSPPPAGATVTVEYEPQTELRFLQKPCFECGTFFIATGTRCGACKPRGKDPRTWYERLLDD